MGLTKNETALTLATVVIAMFLGMAILGTAVGFINGEIVVSQNQFDQAWQFSILFAGAAMMYFGFRAGQSSNGNVTPQG